MIVEMKRIRVVMLAAAVAIAAMLPGQARATVTTTVTYSLTGLPVVSYASSLTIPTSDLTVAANQPATTVANFSYNIGGVSVVGTNTTGGTGLNGTTTYAPNTSIVDNAAIVQGSAPYYYAAPVTDAAGDIYTTPYLSTGLGSITLTFPTAESYLGLLWGSIGNGDTLSFYSGSTLVSTVTGYQAIAAAAGYNGMNGAQGVGGSQYTLINLTGGTFTSVVLSEQTVSGVAYPSFESGGYQYSASNVYVPEPASIALFGVGLIGLGLVRRRTVKSMF